MIVVYENVPCIAIRKIKVDGFENKDYQSVTYYEIIYKLQIIVVALREIDNINNINRHNKILFQKILENLKEKLYILNGEEKYKKLKFGEIESL